MEKPLDEELTGRDKKKFEFYRDFHNVEEAKNFVALLEEKNIPYSLESSDTVIDKAIVGDGFIPKAIIKIKPIDFKRVNEVIVQQVEQLSFTDIEDHYLNQFEDKELQDIFESQEDWNVEDITVAKLILQHRGVEIKDAEITRLREERLEKIREGKEGSKLWMSFYSIGIVVGFFASLFLLIAGFGMSFYYAYGRSSDADGNMYYVFDRQTRGLGKVMLYGGMVVVGLEILIAFFIL